MKKLLVADIISRFGDSIDAIAYSWILYEITGSRTLMALIVGVNFTPTVLLTPFVKELVKKTPQKFVMCVGDFLRFSIVMTVAMLYTSGKLTLNLVLISAVLTSTIETFRVQASKLVITEITKEQGIENGLKKVIKIEKLAEVFGFASVAIIIAKFGVQTALMIDAITFLCSLLILLTVKIPRGIVYKIEKNIAKKYVLKTKEILKNTTSRNIVILACVSNIGIISFSVFQSSYVVNYMQSGKEGLSYIKVAMAIGVIIGGLLATKMKKPTARLGLGVGISLVCLSVFPFIANDFLRIFLVVLAMFELGMCAGRISEVTSGNIEENLAETADFLAVLAIPITAYTSSILALKLQTHTMLLLLGIFIIISFTSFLIIGKIKLKKHLTM